MGKRHSDVLHRASEVADLSRGPQPEETLEELGLIAVPSADKISRDIERQLLLPPRSFPDHWLPVHQVWDKYHTIIVQPAQYLGVLDTGMNTYRYQTC